MDLMLLRQCLAPQKLGHTLEYHECVPSTNDRAGELAAAGAPEGCVVVAGTQTAGRGRRGTRWCDERGKGLLFSAVLRPRLPRELWPVLSLAAAVGTARGIQQAGGVEVRCKWPNDVVAMAGACGNTSLPEPCMQPGATCRYGKLAGIMLEAGRDWAVLGVGINCHGAPRLEPAGAGLPAVSLGDLCPSPPGLEVLLCAVLGQIEAAYDRAQSLPPEETIDDFRCLDITLGMAVTLSCGEGAVCGDAFDIDPTGALLVRTATGVVRCAAGDVHLRRRV